MAKYSSICYILFISLLSNNIRASNFSKFLLYNILVVTNISMAVIVLAKVCAYVVHSVSHLGGNRLYMCSSMHDFFPSEALM